MYHPSKTGARSGPSLIASVWIDRANDQSPTAYYLGSNDCTPKSVAKQTAADTLARVRTRLSEKRSVDEAEKLKTVLQEVAPDAMDQMPDEERRRYLVESLFLNSVTYENEMLDAYMRRLTTTPKGEATSQPAWLAMRAARRGCMARRRMRL